MRFHLLAFTVLVVAAPLLTMAGDGKHGMVHCPRCSEPCYATVTKGTETKHCWNVECKTICIPRVTFPWETHSKACGKSKGNGCDCPEPTKCGRTKTVRVLVKHEYECSVCEYSWNPSSFKGNGSKSNAAPVLQDDVPPPPAVEARSRELRLVPVRQATPALFEIVLP